MKKLLSVFLVTIMMFTLCVSTFAATITIKDHENDEDKVLTGHTFVAYQIFTGDYDENTKTLSNITWGNGVDYDDLVAELKKSTYTSIFNGAFDTLDATKVSCATQLADILATYTSTSVQIEKFIEIALKYIVSAHGITLDPKGIELDYGYYLIVDTTDVDGKYEVANSALLHVAGDDIEINAKVEKPPFEKKVKENADYTSDAGYGVGYNDVATYSIGDTVPFELISSVPNLSQFESYEMQFHDNMSKGLTLNVDSITVTVAGVELEKGNTSEGVHTGDYHISVTYIDNTNASTNIPAGNTVFNIHIPDLKTITIDDGKGGTRALEQGDAVVVTYTATLNDKAIVGLPGNENAAYLEFTNNPDTGESGRTPDDKVIVFTLGLELDKVDGANTTKKLKGVEFVMWKDLSKSAFAVVDSNNKFAKWISVSELTDTNNDQVIDPYDFVSTTDTAIFVTDVSGNVTVAGLDNGTYYVEETKALAGYNNIVGLITITITAKTENGQTWDGTPTSALTSINNDSDKDWLVEQQVVNNGGSVLPETGGIGTVIFATLGCTLILGASVVMVTRKKMSVYED